MNTIYQQYFTGRSPPTDNPKVVCRLKRYESVKIPHPRLLRPIICPAEPLVSAGFFVVERAQILQNSTENCILAVQRVREVVDALPEEDAALLRALYLQTPPLTLRAYSEKTGIPVMTLHYRKEKLLRLLKQQI